MMNMGLSRLKLVRPADPRDRRCRALAGKAYPLVEQAERFESWDEAVAGENLLVGTTSARGRLLQRPIRSARETAAEMAKQISFMRIGVIFGPERTGLNELQLARCQLLASIPARSEHHVLNLSQAVLIFGYELLLALGEASPRVASETVASQQQRQQMVGQLEALLTRVGFLSTSNPDHIMSVVRNLFRPDLTAREVRILRGILSQIEWYFEEGHRLPPEELRKP